MQQHEQQNTEKWLKEIHERTKKRMYERIYKRIEVWNIWIN